jgi:hypothetical protein
MYSPGNDYADFKKDIFTFIGLIGNCSSFEKKYFFSEKGRRMEI